MTSAEAERAVPGSDRADVVSRRPNVRVGYPRFITTYPKVSGTGRMWHRVLAELSREVDLRPVFERTSGWPVSVASVGGSRRRARPFRPDVWLHDGHQGPARARVPTVSELHEAAWSDAESAHLLDPSFTAMYEPKSRAAAVRATRIVTISESSRRQIVAEYGVDEHRVIVGHLGVDHSVFHPGAGDGASVLARAGYDRSRPYVLFVSQLHPRKNLGALRDAMARLAARGFPHSLVLIAGHPVDRREDDKIYSDAEAELPGAPGRVVRLQDLTDNEVAAVMVGASAFCLPSFMEGFGLPAVEAMACGAPVVVSNRGALPEIVGDAGLVCEPTADAIEDRLARVLEDDAYSTQLGQAAVDRSQRFTWAATAASWRRAIDEAVADAG